MLASLSEIATIACTQSLLKLFEDGQDGMRQNLLTIFSKDDYGDISYTILKRLVEYFPQRLLDSLLLALVSEYWKVLNIRKCTSLTGYSLLNVLSKCHQLKIINLTECNQLMLPSLFDNGQKLLPNLTTVIISGCRTVEDFFVQTLLLRDSPHLEHLDLSRCELITDEAFLLGSEVQDKNLLGIQSVNGTHTDESKFSLKSINVSSCEKLTSLAVAYICALAGSTLQNLDVSYTNMSSLCLFYMSGYSLQSAFNLFLRKNKIGLDLAQRDLLQQQIASLRSKYKKDIVDDISREETGLKNGALCECLISVKQQIEKSHVNALSEKDVLIEITENLTLACTPIQSFCDRIAQDQRSFLTDQNDAIGSDTFKNVHGIEDLECATDTNIEENASNASVFTLNEEQCHNIGCGRSIFTLKCLSDSETPSEDSHCNIDTCNSAFETQTTNTHQCLCCKSTSSRSAVCLCNTDTCDPQCQLPCHDRCLANRCHTEVRSYYSSSLKTVKVVCIAVNQQLDSSIFPMFFSSNKGLTHFSTNWPFLANGFVDLLVQNLTCLQELCLPQSDSMMDEDINKLAKLTKLKKIDLKGIFISNDLAVRNIITQEILSLNLSECSITDMTLTKVAKKGATTLKELDLSWCDDVTEEGINVLTAACSALQLVNLRHCSVSSQALFNMSEKCQGLRELRLAGIEGIPDQAVIDLAKNLQFLEEIDISWNTEISDDSIKALFKYCKKLKVGIFTGNKRITSEPMFCLVPGLRKWQATDLERRRRMEGRVKEMKLENCTNAVNCTCEEKEICSLPQRSQVYAPNLLHMDLCYVDHMDDSLLADIVAFSFGSLEIVDYYGEMVVPSKLEAKNGRLFSVK